MFRGVLPQEGWKMLAALSATWTGGSANLIAVKQVIGLSDSSLPRSAARRCTVLFHLGGDPVFRRGRCARFQPLDSCRIAADSRIEAAAQAAQPAHPGGVLLWLGLALLVGLGAARVATSVA